MADIKAGKVNTIVVYKIDRLTRSLADFSKMVELFDTYNVTFVSVTQQFNTTTSMGRLTLNVLLSFAQFEREVTGERIRDKVAASKAKGIWMGGCVPLGYDLVERKLVVNPVEAKLVKHIFERYVALKSANQLIDELHKAGFTTKSWTSKSGHTKGGRPFMSGPLYYLLSNRIYLGEIVHRKQSYPGNHEALIDVALWEQVQKTRQENRYEHRHRTQAKERSLLAGKLFDADGLIMTPSHSNKKGKRYRYYINRAKLLGKTSSAQTVGKIPAHEIETAVGSAVRDLLGNPMRLAVDLTLNQRQHLQDIVTTWGRRDNHTVIRDVVERVVLAQDRITCHLAPQQLGLLAGLELETLNPDIYEIEIPIRLKRVQGGATMVVFPNTPSKPANPKLIRAIAKGFFWNTLLMTGQVKSMKELVKIAGVNSRYISKLLPLAWLAPAVIEAVLEGREPERLQLGDYLKLATLDWERQQAKLRVI